MTIIQNEHLLVSITDTGMELSSIKRKSDNREYLWQANPDVWSSHAPVLFPNIGMLKDGHFTYQGKQYPLPKHGFVRRNPNIRIVEYFEDSVTFALDSSPALQLIYPFAFSFRLTYRLEGNALHQEHLILNEDETPLYFSVGGHPAFNVPHFDGESYEDYHLLFEQEESSASHTVTEAGLIGATTRTVPWNGYQLPLTHELFSKDALVFKDLKSKEVSLVSKTHGKVLSVNYDDFDYLGIWAKPNGDFICIEPWLGLADNHDTNGDITTKEGIVELGGLGVFNAGFSMRFY